MSTTPRISIVVPTYNGARYIRCALQSALRQTVWPWELIVSDSGSTDNTLELIEKETAGAPFKVRVLPSPTAGMVCNWNAVTAAAEGDYIKFLFQDDALEPQCLQRMQQLVVKDPKIGFVWCARRAIGETGVESHPLAKWLIEHPDLDAGKLAVKSIQEGRRILSCRQLLDGNWNKIGEPSAVMIKRSVFHALDGFNEGLIQLVDLELWLRALAITWAGYIAEPLAVFRVHPEQVSLKNADTRADEGDWMQLMRTLATPQVYRYLHLSVRRRIREELSGGEGERVPRKTLLDHGFVVGRSVKRSVRHFISGIRQRRHRELESAVEPDLHEVQHQG